MTIIGVLFCLLPAAQLLFSVVYIENLSETFFSILFVPIFCFPIIIPIIGFYILMRDYFIGKNPTMWQQIAVGLITILLYIMPIMLSLAWITDFNNIAGDALSGILLIVIPAYLIGLSIVPGVVLVFTQNKS